MCYIYISRLIENEITIVINEINDKKDYYKISSIIHFLTMEDILKINLLKKF